MLFAPCQHDYSNTGDMISPPKIEKAASGLVWMDLTDWFLCLSSSGAWQVCVSASHSR